MKILAAQIDSITGDFEGNIKKILYSIQIAKQNNCSILITSELAITGYPPQDLLLLPEFAEKAADALQPLIAASQNIILVIGTIRKNEEAGKPLFNTAAVCYQKKLIGFQDKTQLASYDAFDERRYFEPALKNEPWTLNNTAIGITIGGDMLQNTKNSLQTPIHYLKDKNLDLAVNLSAFPYCIGKFTSRIDAAKHAATVLKCPFVLCNQVGGRDSLIFDGYSLLINSKGELAQIAKGFKEDNCIMDTSSVKIDTPFPEPMEELHQALLLGLKDYFFKQGLKKACIGISGGIDSALVACLAVEALGKENVLGIAMPSPYSSPESITDAKKLASNLSIPLSIIPINAPFETFLELLSPYFLGKEPDTTEENLQARIRGMILMALSNKHGYIVLSTGNKSEFALGYSTLYGDMCGGLSVICDLLKDQVYALSRHINSKTNLIPENTFIKAPSAELRTGQKDSDTLPEYPIVDAVVRGYIEQGMHPRDIACQANINPLIVNDLIKKIHANEYKRRQSPPGLKVTEKAFNIDCRFPIVQKWVS